MKAKYVFVALAAAALIVGGIWLARERKPAPVIENSSGDVGSGSGGGVKNPAGGSNDAKAQPGHSLRPPDQMRTFREMTPEQRVEQARKGHGPGG